MYRYLVISGSTVVYQTDSAREAHQQARYQARTSGQSSRVVRVICKWEMQAVRRNQ